MKNQKLQPHNQFIARKGPVVLVVLDGVGLGPEDESNGVYAASTPILDNLIRDNFCFTQLKAHGTAVGLPSDGDMGNSEVGHNALGAGRIFPQGAMLVNEAFSSGAIFRSRNWQEVKKRCVNGGTLHLIGLVSDGNVHSHLDHLYYLLKECAETAIKKVRIHGLLDGRDVGAKSALSYFTPLEEQCRAYQKEGCDFKIGSGGGRMVTTMDRYEADWSVVERGWKAHVLGTGRCFSSALEAINTYYQEDPDLTDQYMAPFVIGDENGPIGKISDGDAVVLFNFRGDRSIEISRAFEEENFTAFDRGFWPDVFFAGLMQYDGDANIPKHYLVEPPQITGTISEYLCSAGVRSFAVSETQKFGHVTYFWNGNNSGYVNPDLEKYVEIASDRVTFDQRPWMKAAEITDAAIAAITSDKYDFIRLNYANGDMVGHTGNPEAIMIAIESVDLSLGRLLKAIEKYGGVAVITADHGNADCMWVENGGIRKPMVAHTLNPVPLVIKFFDERNRYRVVDLDNAGLANVAATILTLLGFQPPDHYNPALIELQ